MLGLVVGKSVGTLGTTSAVSRLTRPALDDQQRWLDVLGLAMLAGIGFTVSLLIGELAFGVGSEAEEHAKVGVLTGSLLAAVLATAVLRPRNRAYRQMREAETIDSDADGIPDVYQH